jgi:hypothetical protein
MCSAPLPLPALVSSADEVAALSAVPDPILGGEKYDQPRTNLSSFFLYI